MHEPTLRFTGLARRLAERELTLPFLCLFASHRPWAFVAGQALYLLEPFAAFFGGRSCGEWAELLSDAEALNHLERALGGGSTPPGDQTVTPL